MSIPMAGPFAPNLRISFAIPKRLLSVTWRTEGEVTLGNALRHAKRTPVRLLGRACLIPQREGQTQRSAGFAMDILWDFIGVAMEGLSELLG